MVASIFDTVQCFIVTYNAVPKYKLHKRRGIFLLCSWYIPQQFGHCLVNGRFSTNIFKWNSWYWQYLEYILLWLKCKGYLILEFWKIFPKCFHLGCTNLSTVNNWYECSFHIALWTMCFKFQQFCESYRKFVCVWVCVCGCVCAHTRTTTMNDYFSH